MGSEVSVPADTADGSTGDDESQRRLQTTRTHVLSLSHAHNKFCIQLYQEYAKEGKRPGNFVLAPIGISITLGLLYAGAKGPTKDEIHKVLHLGEITKEQLLPAFAAMHWDVLRSSFPKGCVFEVALRLFAQSQINLTTQYEDICMHYEITRLKQADFKMRPDKARTEINQWAEERTRNTIKDAIPQGIIDRDTKILGLCGLYMKTLWLHPFDPKKTESAPFFLSMKETPNVRMMSQKRILRHTFHTKLDCEAIEIPYANNYTKMLILLPRKVDGVQKLELKLDRKSLETIYDHLEEDYVHLYLPRFRFELGLILGDMLKKLGIKSMFVSGKADFSNINNAHDLHVSRIFHHVYMEFDEGVPHGSSSMTGSHGKEKRDTPSLEEAHSSLDNDSTIIRCDHPFLFFVRDDRTGAISFLGRVVRPIPAS